MKLGSFIGKQTKTAKKKYAQFEEYNMKQRKKQDSKRMMGIERLEKKAKLDEREFKAREKLRKIEEKKKKHQPSNDMFGDFGF